MDAARCKMKITFIRPHLATHRSADAMEPLVFGILAALTPPDVELALYDERLESIPYDEPTDLVALTVETFTAKRAYQIATQYRRRGTPVVMGGYHPTLLPAEAGQYADAVVIGDAESIWGEVVADARAGKLSAGGCAKRVYQSPPNLETQGVTPDRKIFANKKYGLTRIVQVGRGCKFSCDFCSIHAFYGNSMPRRCLDDVLAEMDDLRGKYVFFADDNLFSNLEESRALFKALIPYKIHWGCQISSDAAQDPTLLDLMAQSGCIGAFIGFESLNAANLAQMRKKWNFKHGNHADTVARFYERGIMVFGTFVFGYDHDTPEAFDRALEFAMQSKMALAQFNSLIPIPATPLYNRLQAEKRLIYERWWLDDNYRYGETVFYPKNMTPRQLEEGSFRLRRDFGSYGSIAKRALAPQTNARSPYHLLAYLAMNLASITEIRNKQGEALGDGSAIQQINNPPTR